MGPFVSYEELVVLRKRSQVPSYNNNVKKFLTLSEPKLQVLFSANKGYKPGKSFGRERRSTVDLLALTRLDL
jgi:hypothetical protein